MGNVPISLLRNLDTDEKYKKQITRNKMKKHSKRILNTVIIFFFILAVSTAQGLYAEDFLKGTVIALDGQGKSLAKQFDIARDEFKKSGKGDTFFTGYIFQSRHNIHWGGEKGGTGTYTVGVSSKKIKMKRPGRTQGERYDTEEGGEPAGILFLQKTSGSRTELLDIQLIDLDNTYDFSDIPLYWLGDQNTDASVDYLDSRFDSAEPEAKKSMIFICSSHDSEKTYNFLTKIASGDYPSKYRKDAIFLIGNDKDQRSLKFLKQIFAKEDSTELKKQIVFAMYLSDMDEAIREIITIAKKDESSTVRKQAIFWLGQKATVESTEALKDFVERDEDVEVKKQAVFAISQLPKEKAVPMLIDIARSNKSPKVRKNAMFWLGQKDSDEALKFFEEILLKK